MTQDLQLLKSIYSTDNVKQRSLAEASKVSLGLINSMIKRLSEKGLLQILEKNRRDVQYLVTSKGLDLLSKQSYRSFKTDLDQLVMYRELLVSLVEDIQKKGYDGALLIGSSKVDFLVEWACLKAGIDYVTEDDYEGKVVNIYSETYIPERENIESIFLQKLFLEGVLR